VTIPLAALLGAGPTTATTIAKAHKSSGSILDPIAKPIAWVLAEIYSVIPNYAVAIILLSVVWMVLISPLTLKSTRSMLAMQKLQPKLKKLQEQHKNDKAAFAQAQMDLFREHKVSPFGSCLPMLLPMPVFFGLFRVITGLSHKISGVAADCTTHVTGAVAQTCPKYLGHNTEMYKNIVRDHGHLSAFGMDLSLNAFSHHSSVGASLPFWILLLVMAGTGYMQSAQMMSRNPNAAQNPQMRLMKYLPLLFTIFFIRFPAGVLLYYAMSNVCRIVQQDLMYRFDPKVKALVAQEVQEVEALTHEIDEKEAGRGKGPNRGSGGSGARPSAPRGSPTGGAGVNNAAGSGRSRFRDLLSAAAEQQQQRSTPAKPLGPGDTTKSAKPLGPGDTTKSAKPPGPGATSKPASPAKPAAPTTNGSAAAKGPATNGSNAGQSQSRTGKAPPKGNRTNRKRRGR
jgi:YidC/Oxa1 family membrane protein insertase